MSSKTVIASFGFTYVFGCCPLRWLSHRSGRQPKTYVKPEAAITVFELMMMDGVSPETCWAIKKHWNNKFYYTVASCCFFLWDLYYCARIHEHQLQKNYPCFLLTILQIFCCYHCSFSCLALWRIEFVTISRLANIFFFPVLCVDNTHSSSVD